jgi:hypothetical protein
MKGSGKPAGLYTSPKGGMSVFLRENRRCMKCGNWFTSVSYKISPLDYLCVKHREEAREQEAEELIKKII